MITVKNGLVDIKGTNEELFNDLSSVCGYLRDCLRTYLNEDKAQEKILLAVERGFLINEKMDTKTVSEMYKITKKLEEKVG